MDWMEILKGIILGVVEGLTEFAPVSSTGHMIIVDDMWLKSEEFLTKYVANTFKVVIQLGSILAVVVLFFNRFLDLLGIRKDKSVPHDPGAKRLKLGHIIVGLIPAGAMGVLFEDKIDEYLFSTRYVLLALIAGAALMIAADKLRPKVKTETVDEITYRQALIVGLVQCVSLWPGFSRSGSTISGGILVGLSHRAAADFTFLMAVPIMLGASALSLYKNWQYFTADAWPVFIAGFIAAFVVAYISIRFFLKLINRVKLIPFAIYRIVLAVIIYLAFVA